MEFDRIVSFRIRFCVTHQRVIGTRGLRPIVCQSGDANTGFLEYASDAQDCSVRQPYILQSVLLQCLADRSIDVMYI
jgi:hypothetical protein